MKNRIISLLGQGFNKTFFGNGKTIKQLSQDSNLIEKWKKRDLLHKDIAVGSGIIVASVITGIPSWIAIFVSIKILQEILCKP